MMNVNELKSVILDYILKFNLDKNFCDNPTFKSVLSKISSNLDGIINEVNKYEKIPVKLLENRISFSYSPIDYLGRNTITYNFDVYSNKPSELSCIKQEIRRPSFIDDSGNSITEKYVDEITANLSVDGSIKVSTNHVEADNLNCPKNKCAQMTHSIEMKYNKYGIMDSKDEKIFDRCILNADIESTNAEMLLFVGKNCFDEGKFSDFYHSRSNFLRKAIDIAEYKVYDDNKSIVYSGVTQLDSKDLKEINYNGGSIYQKYIFIPQLSTDEIYSMINNENDSKVREGLKLYANGRENYYYDSSEDNEFIYDGNHINEKIY